MSKFNPFFLIPDYIYWWRSVLSLNNRNVPQDPKLTGGQTTNAKNISAVRGICPRTRQSVAATPSKQSSWTLPAPGPCSPPPKKVSQHSPQGWADNSSTHSFQNLLSQSPNVTTHYIHQICHRLILSILSSQIYPPNRQVKRVWHRLQKGFQKISKSVGPWPHHRIKWPLIRYTGFFILYIFRSQNSYFEQE